MESETPLGVIERGESMDLQKQPYFQVRKDYGLSQNMSNPLYKDELESNQVKKEIVLKKPIMIENDEEKKI